MSESDSQPQDHSGDSPSNSTSEEVLTRSAVEEIVAKALERQLVPIVGRLNPPPAENGGEAVLLRLGAHRFLP